MDSHHLIEDNVELIDRIVARTCRRLGIAAAEVDDLAGMVKLALVENDYAILRRYEGRSSLATYLAVVVQRLMADQRERSHGRWRPSPEAQRLGPRGVLIEDVVGRQGRSIEEAMPIVRSIDASITPQEVAEISQRLPRRSPRPREVELPPETTMPLVSADRADTAAADGELRDISRHAGTLLRETMERWPAEDRLLVRLRFESSLAISDIARLMNVPQRPLYRRLESLLGCLREVLVGSGVDPATAGDLLDAARRVELEFGPMWKSDDAHRTKKEADRAWSEDRSL